MICAGCRQEMHVAYQVAHESICESCFGEFVSWLREKRRCTCPTGFGQVCDPGCPVHGVRAPAHTITGAS